jgi:nitronate monooxygenase
MEEAIRVVESGTDIVVAQGAEAGGHRSTFQIDPNSEPPLIGTMALVPQVVDAISTSSSSPVPVIVSGGIVDGRGLVAALSLGASGVMIETRFLLARESGVWAAYQERLLAAKETDTLITRAFTGRPACGIRNRFVDEYLKSGLKPLAWPLQALAADDIYKAAQIRGEADYFPLLAGQGLRLLSKSGHQNAAEIIEELVTEAKNILTKLNGTVE